MESLLAYLQIGTNIFALSIVGWLYLAYIRTLSSKHDVSQETISLLKEQIKVHKEKILDLESKTPDRLVVTLDQRIKIFVDEISRLEKDKDSHKDEIKLKNIELMELREELQKVKEVKDKISSMKEDLVDDDILSIDLNDYGLGVFTQKFENYRCFQDLLDDLFKKYLHHEHPPYSYEMNWKIIEEDTGISISSVGRSDMRSLSEAGLMGGVKYKVVKNYE